MRKGRGPRGIGCAREICWRVVLDSNCLRFSPILEIQALAERGWQLTVPFDALREFWAQSKREQSQEGLENRIRAIVPWLSKEHPVAFGGYQLLMMTGIVRPDRQDAELRAAVATTWKRLVSTGFASDQWLQVGRELDAELEKDEADFLGAFEEHMKPALAARRELLRLGVRSSRSAFEQKIRGAVPSYRLPAVRERMNLMFCFLSQKGFEAVSRQPEGNDVVDGRLLTCLAWPAFLVTVDYRLIEAVDRTRSRQRAWVRTPVEMIEDSIWRCAPWGKPCESLKLEFQPRSIPQLKERQHKYREALRLRKPS